ncbi:hypothetical protein TNCV_56441 [Trichonephila clavipes]|nr:hypothetical protein TNCV_56441 [Trichonephila clavipes]
MLFQFVRRLDPSIHLSALKESGFLSVFIIYQIIDVTVIESFVFNQARAAAGALRECALSENEAPKTQWKYSSVIKHSKLGEEGERMIYVSIPLSGV